MARKRWHDAWTAKLGIDRLPALEAQIAALLPLGSSVIADVTVKIKMPIDDTMPGTIRAAMDLLDKLEVDIAALMPSGLKFKFVPVGLGKMLMEKIHV